jgi:putative membrane protein
LVKPAAIISYNTKDWFSFIFGFHKADSFHKLLPLIITICMYAGNIVRQEPDYRKLSETSYIKNIPIMHGLPDFYVIRVVAFMFYVLTSPELIDRKRKIRLAKILL